MIHYSWVSLSLNEKSLDIKLLGRRFEYQFKFEGRAKCNANSLCVIVHDSFRYRFFFQQFFTGYMLYQPDLALLALLLPSLPSTPQDKIPNPPIDQGVPHSCGALRRNEIEIQPPLPTIKSFGYIFHYPIETLQPWLITKKISLTTTKKKRNKTSPPKRPPMRKAKK